MVSDRHLVHFYEDDAGFADLVIAWLADGLRAGGPCVVIATPPHLALLHEKLSQAGASDGGVSCLFDSYFSYDAPATLAGFMVDGWPDAERFGEVLGGILSAAARGRPQPVRMFGEMVSLLMAGTTPQAAVALEKLWNQLLVEERFVLLCSYPRTVFLGTLQKALLEAICAAHKGVCLP